jgi:hypothetical protein
MLTGPPPKFRNSGHRAASTKRKASFSRPTRRDVGRETGTTVSPDYTAHTSRFNGKINWVQIDLGEDAEDADHYIDPDERFRIAMARQQSAHPLDKRCKPGDFEADRLAVVRPLERAVGSGVRNLTAHRIVVSGQTERAADLLHSVECPILIARSAQ